MKRSIYGLIVYLFIYGFSSCGKEEPKYTIPASSVNFIINTSFLDNHLSSGGNIGIYLRSKDKSEYDKLITNIKSVKTYQGDGRSGNPRLGYSGLMIINTGAILGETPYAAFDLCCPNEKRENVRVVPTNDGTAECPHCHSTFDIMLGSGRPISGVASENLQSYYVSREGQDEFRIYYY